MGYERHNTIVVTFPDYVLDPSRIGIGSGPVPDVAAFRAALPAEWQKLIVGPIPSITNDYITWVFAPDGSKEGWKASDQGDEYRQRFLDMFSFAWSDGSSPYDVLVVDARFGGDEPGAGYEDELIVKSNLHCVKLETAGDD